MHKAAIFCIAEQRGKSIQTCLLNSNLRTELILSKTLLQNEEAMQFDAFLVLAQRPQEIGNLPDFLFTKPHVLLCDGDFQQLSNSSYSFDRIFRSPFNFDEISLMVRNMIFMRKGIKDDNKLILSDLVLDFNVRDAARAGASLRLSHKEFCLLEFFMRNHSRALTRNQILDNVWDSNDNIFTNTIDVHVAKLRRKLDPQRPDRFIKTVHGFGYMLDT